jgi:glycosyltransferase involved in cell wall biosynthesis
LAQKGRGGAIRAAWAASQADILMYMDVDLATDLSAFLPMIDCLAAGKGDIAVGTRFAAGAFAKRGIKRTIISKLYVFLVRHTFRSEISDFQCGFKAITRQAAIQLLPHVKDNDFFLDTELLIFAEHFGYKISEIPVQWVEGSDSRVNIWGTALHDIKGLIRLRRELRSFRSKGIPVQATDRGNAVP